jgi:hypothetical protein
VDATLNNLKNLVLGRRLREHKNIIKNMGENEIFCKNCHKNENFSRNLSQKRKLFAKTIPRTKAFRENEKFGGIKFREI